MVLGSFRSMFVLLSQFLLYIVESETWGKVGGIKKGFLEMMKGKQGNKKKKKVACANLANLGASGASKVNSFGAELEPVN